MMSNDPEALPDLPPLPKGDFGPAATQEAIDGRSPTDLREAALTHAVEVSIASINHNGTVGGVDNIVEAAEKFRAFLAGESPSPGRAAQR